MRGLYLPHSSRTPKLHNNFLTGQFPPMFLNIKSKIMKQMQKWSEGDPDKYAEACYDLAVSQLNDKDKPKWIREYFKL